ncbi:MAG: ABC transporter substrate-binding protein [Sphaerochaeta sp.]
MKCFKKVLVFLVIALLSATVVFANGTSETRSAQKQSIKLWLGWPSLENIFKQIKADFEAANPNVELEITAMSVRDLEQKLAVSLPSGSGPDILITSEYIIPRYIGMGYIATPPASVVDFVENNFDELVKSINKFKGPEDSEEKIYGVPHIGIARVQYVNLSLMKELGLNPVTPTTWEEQMKIAKAMTQYDSNGNITRSGMSLRIFGGGSGIGEKFMIKLVQAGGSFVGRTADGKWKAAYNSEAGVDTLEYYINALYKYKVDSFEAKHDTEAFVNGLTGMYDRELFPITDIHSRAPEIEFATAPMPGYKFRGTVYSTESYFVSQSSKNKDIAWDFIIFCQKEEYVKRFFVERGWIPPRTDIDFSDIYAIYPEFKAAYEFPEGYKFWVYPKLVECDEIITKFAEHLVDIFKNTSLLDNRDGMMSVLNELAKETNEILKENGNLGEGPIVKFGDVIDAPRNL